MPSDAISRAERLSFAAILALTLWRLAWLPAAQLDLFVDESQYWLWGREMALGAYSKPPLVGWMIRGVTALANSDAPWVVRVPWPVVHGLAAIVLMALGRRVAGPAVGALAGVSYVTMPAVSLGSILVSTDTPLMLAVATALLLWHRQAAGAGLVNAVGLGLAIAVGLWAKYAMLFVLAGMALAVLADAGWRLRWRDAAVAFVVAVAAFAPNLVWNAHHGMATLRHTAEIATRAPGLDWTGLASFTASQLAVAGPVLFAAIVLAWRGSRQPRGVRGLLVATSVILGIVMAQALRGGANANWAVAAYAPGVVVAACLLARRPRWTTLSLLIGAIPAVALPVLATRAEGLRLPDGQLAMARYVGQAAVSDWAIAAARDDAGGEPVLFMLSDRALTADLMYRTGRRGGAADVTVRAAPPRDRLPNSHYEMHYPLRAEQGPAYWLGRDGKAPLCSRSIAVTTPADGVWAGTTLNIAGLDPACLDTLR